MPTVVTNLGPVVGRRHTTTMIKSQPADPHRGSGRRIHFCRHLQIATNLYRDKLLFRSTATDLGIEHPLLTIGRFQFGLERHISCSHINAQFT